MSESSMSALGIALICIGAFILGWTGCSYFMEVQP